MGRPPRKTLNSTRTFSAPQGLSIALNGLSFNTLYNVGTLNREIPVFILPLAIERASYLA